MGLPLFFAAAVVIVVVAVRFGGLLRAGSGEMVQLFTRPPLRPPALNDHHNDLILIFDCLRNSLKPHSI